MHTIVRSSVVYSRSKCRYSRVQKLMSYPTLSVAFFSLIDRILTERGFVVIVRLVELAVIYKSIYNSTREAHVNHT